jgi:hypothetical protein
MYNFSGTDHILAELFQARGSTLCSEIHKLIQVCAHFSTLAESILLNLISSKLLKVYNINILVPICYCNNKCIVIVVVLLKLYVTARVDCYLKEKSR